MPVVCSEVYLNKYERHFRNIIQLFLIGFLWIYTRFGLFSRGNLGKGEFPVRTETNVRSLSEHRTISMHMPGRGEATTSKPCEKFITCKYLFKWHKQHVRQMQSATVAPRPACMQWHIMQCGFYAATFRIERIRRTRSYHTAYANQ